MVVAATAAIALIGLAIHRYRDGGVQGTTQVLNTAFAKLLARRAATACRWPRATRRAWMPATHSPAATGWWMRTPTSCGRCWCASRGCTVSSVHRVRAAGVRRSDGGGYLRAAAAVVAGHRGQRDPDRGADPGQAGHLYRYRQLPAAERARHLPAFPGQSVDDPAGDRVRGDVRCAGGRAADLADRADPDRAQARFPAAAGGRAVLPDHRDPPGVRPDHRDPLV